MSETRQVIAKVIHPTGEITWREGMTINAENRVVIHHIFGGICNEGPDGQPFNKVFRNVSHVDFTGRLQPFRPGEKLEEVVEVHVTTPYGADQTDHRAWEATFVNKDSTQEVGTPA